MLATITTKRLKTSLCIVSTALTTSRNKPATVAAITLIPLMLLLLASCGPRGAYQQHLDEKYCKAHPTSCDTPQTTKGKYEYRNN